MKNKKSNFGSGNLLAGALMVLGGSASYGMLSTFVKIAYAEGYTTAEVTVAQIFWGVLALTAMARLLPKNSPGASREEVVKLMIAGTTIGFTSVFYYVGVSYINASIAVVLLMQSIWMGVVFECAINKIWPTLDKAIAVILVLFGTLLATNVINPSSFDLDATGVIFGLAAALSFSCTLAATGSIAKHLSPIKRSQYMLYGGLIVVSVFGFISQIGPHYLQLNLIPEEFIRNKPFDFKIIISYGLFLGIFGTIVPPILLNKGFPITGVGLGSIISSIELPFAALIASALLGEVLLPIQLAGIAIIVLSVFLLNYRVIRDKRDLS